MTKKKIMTKKLKKINKKLDDLHERFCGDYKNEDKEDKSEDIKINVTDDKTKANLRRILKVVRKNLESKDCQEESIKKIINLIKKNKDMEVLIEVFGQSLMRLLERAKSEGEELDKATCSFTYATLILILSESGYLNLNK